MAKIWKKSDGSMVRVYPSNYLKWRNQARLLDRTIIKPDVANFGFTLSDTTNPFVIMESGVKQEDGSYKDEYYSISKIDGEWVSIKIDRPLSIFPTRESQKQDSIKSRELKKLKEALAVLESAKPELLSKIGYSIEVQEGK